MTLSVLHTLVPQPAQVELAEGQFELTPETVIVTDAVSNAVGEQLAATLRAATGLPLPIRLDEGEALYADGAAPILRLRAAPELASLGGEGYTLRVQEGDVTISAATAQGLFYGAQTLRQLLPPEVFSATRIEGVPWTIRCLSIEDAPRFGWRGLMLDACRHFMPKDAVLKFLDTMALHKFNVFHLHLTEDQGWRIEIKKYPLLTKVGSQRAQTVIGRNTPNYDGTPHGGFYTQDDIREIVAYAAARHITVVPEIEMPGHARAALAAYPHLACTPGPFTVAEEWGVFEDVYDAGNDEVFTFLGGVLDEILELFPSRYIHIGGDECPKTRWKACPRCQARIKAEGLKDEHELQSYFVRRIEAYLNTRGRSLIGWDEILEGGLAPTATVMSWRGEEGGIVSAQAGHDVVMAPNPFTYFDHYQSEDHNQEPLAFGGYTSLEKVYGYEPVPSELTPEQAQHVLGAQAQHWTEYMLDYPHVEYMAYPRACAMAEVLWCSPETKDYTDFLTRLRTHLRRLDALGVNYRPLS